MYAAEMGSGAMIYIYIYIYMKFHTDSAIQKLIRGIHRYRQQEDSINLFSISFQNEEVYLKRKLFFNVTLCEV
jgi:hypothetical protein